MQIGILPPKLNSIEELFAGNARFTVPRYQRSFAWTSDETEEFWEDLFSAVERGSGSGEYFLGTVVLQRVDQDTQEIIDGQQRLTCVSMIFSAIRNVFLTAEDARSVKVEPFLGSSGFGRNAVMSSKLTLNKINNETFIEYVIHSENLAKVELALRNKEINPSNRLLLQAYKYFLEKVTQHNAAKGTKSDEFLVPLIDTLRTKLKLIAIPVASNEDANLFFESLNARGKELAISDLVKNRLYFEAKNQVNRAEQLWDKMEKHLGSRPLPEFIRHYWIAKQLEKDGPNVREKHLYRKVATVVKDSQSKALTLLKDLSKSAPDYSRISDYSLWPEDPAYDESFSDTLDDLRLFRTTQMSPLLLNAIQQFSSAKDIAKTFRVVANFAFRYFIIGNQSPGNLERVYANIAYEIRNSTYKSSKDVADALRGVNTDPTFRANFEIASLEGKRIARYTLAKINNHLTRQASASGGELITNPDGKQANLEHVFPESNPASWHGAFSSTVKPSDYVYRIGNLTILKAKINREQADKSFKEKRAIGLDDSPLKINEVFRGLSKWGDREIDQRQQALAKAALEVWKL